MFSLATYIEYKVHYTENPILIVTFLPFHRMTCKLESLIITPWKGFTCLKHIQIIFVVLLCIPRSLSYWQAAVRVLWYIFIFIIQLFLGFCLVRHCMCFVFFCRNRNPWASCQHDSCNFMLFLCQMHSCFFNGISTVLKIWNIVASILVREDQRTLLLSICRWKRSYMCNLAVIWEFATLKFCFFKKMT